MERPAPAVVSPHHLYVDLRQADITVEETLRHVHSMARADVLGFEMFAATKTLALIFPSSELRAKYVNQSIPELDLPLYAAPSAKAIIRKYTLLGVPLHDSDGVTSALRTALKDHGEVVQLVPMVQQGTGYWSTTWHLSLNVPSEDTPQPPPLLDLLGHQVICDIPGQRRFCQHCNGVNHSLATCRQGQWLRQKARQLQQAQAALTASLQESADAQTHQPDKPHQQSLSSEHQPQQQHLQYAQQYAHYVQQLQQQHNQALPRNDSSHMDYQPTHLEWAQMSTEEQQQWITAHDLQSSAFGTGNTSNGYHNSTGNGHGNGSGLASPNVSGRHGTGGTQ